MLTVHRTVLTTRNLTSQHVPPTSPAPTQQLPSIAEEGGSAGGEDASGEAISRQSGGREDLDDLSDLDVTEDPDLVTLPEDCFAPAAAPGNGTAGNMRAGKMRPSTRDAGSAPPAPSTSSERTGVRAGSHNSGSRSSSGSTSDSGSDSGSDSSRDPSSDGDGGDQPAVLAGRAAHKLNTFGSPLALDPGRTRSQSRGWQMSASCAEVLLSYAEEAVALKGVTRGWNPVRGR